MDFLKGDPKSLHFTALYMWANYIETGDVNMSAETAVRCKQEEEIKTLSDDQKRLVLRLRDEAGLTLQNGLQAKS